MSNKEVNLVLYFDLIPYAHHTYGFYIAVGLMLIVPVWMLVVFKRRGWF